ncbi:hypothetical protein RFI_01110 [Reticulomyxa filosa]|uniref:WD-40 repeat protein n=1 Tax=Reticulomyxa filosa TaxID=46433 RepID=X6PE55_RETFI|nr:hypothetical protein RFI_01110 [Reticulomyxa filosa]|eukprot:ETO35952.1 hypothetical protein RFI_01110 [Reticulomyxa filosa]
MDILIGFVLLKYSPFVINNSIGNSNVICSGSCDNTISFWDIRSNKNELYMIKEDYEDDGILCLKFIGLKKKEKTKNVIYDLNLFYAILNLFDLIECKYLKKIFCLFAIIFVHYRTLKTG